jgi:alkylated DNA repair dioxygenase AlkB
MLIFPEFLRSKNYALPETGDAASDWGSDATTEQEEPCVAPESTRLSQEQSHLLKIAEQLFANRKPGMKKPAPSGQPEVWAEGRQELCETLHYYRAYQSGCYSTGGFARGFMFDKVAHERDYIDNDVVISRAGGGLVKDNESGRDQADQGPVVTALKNCMTHCNPVVILAGADNPHIPSQPPHQYCVLDYFKPTHIWVEKSGNGKIVRYRFEKLNTHKKSWWSPENEEDQVELGSLDPPVERICNCCGELSMQIYLNGWMCLQPSCTTFWHIMEDMNFSSHGKSKEPVEVELIYDPRFLKQKTPWPNDNFEYSLKYDGPQVSEHAVPGEDTSQSFSSGIVCPDCGRCNSRLAWAGWECSTPNCNFKMLPRHSLVPARSLHERFWPLSDSYTMSRDTHVPLLELTISFAHGYRINRYQIPGLDGFITHMIANKTVVEENGGPNAMFEELQETDIDLRRRVMPNGQLKGDSHCCHFSVNYGMPYKFIAATASHSFDGAARPINATRSRLNWAAKYLAAQDTARLRLAQQTNRSLEEGQRLKNYHEVLASQTKMVMEEGNDAEEFNEVLALGYFESQKMNYHDDGEFGLGPTVATLSLGAPGTMRIRMKDRHYHGASAAGVYDDARPIPGCSQYEARLALQSELDTLKASDPKAYGARRKQIPKELKLKHSGHAKDVLKMELGHGDIVVMHGTELQKYYEHAVDHAGKLRFALTCRYIDPKSLKEADQPDYEVGPDLGGYDGAKLC